MSKNIFSKTSEWVAAGNLKTGLVLIECSVCSQTAKAIGFAAKKFNEFGTLKPRTAWFPKAYLQRVENDFYVNGPTVAYLVPQWLYSSKLSEGYEI